MYYKLPIKDRMDLMKSYKKANPNMSYHDMVNDYNTSYEKFGDGGTKKDNTNVVINNGVPVKSLNILKEEYIRDTNIKKKKDIYLNSLRKELDSIQNQALRTSNIFDQMQMRHRAGEIFKELGQSKPELVKKEIETARNAGKGVIASAKYIFPITRPLVNGIEGALAVKDMYDNPNTHNTASLLTEVAPYINNKYSKVYGLMGDYLTGQEIGLLPKDK